MISVDAKKLMEAGAHYGHQSRRWNPKMKPYLYGVSDGVHVFDLIKTKGALEEALGILESTSKAGKSILIIGTKKQAKEKVQETALATGCLYVNERWLGGTLTNFDQIKSSIKKLAEMKKNKEDGKYKDRTKKERVLIDREITRLERFFGGIAEMEKLPDLIVIIDTKRQAGAVAEANAKEIEIIGIVDSNSDPTPITYPIPMNDDATRAIEYVLDLIKNAILEGKSKSKNKS